MATRAEKTALVFLTVVVFAGALVRMGRSIERGMRPHPAAQTALALQRRAVDSAARLRSSGVRSRTSASTTGTPRAPRPERASVPRPTPSPRAPRASSARSLPFSEPIDVDEATAAELERLPRIGPALAARIVAERSERGPFGSLDVLQQRVKGVGPGLAKLLAPHVTFSRR